MAVAASGLDQQHLDGRIRAQAIRENAAGRAAAGDDIVRRRLRLSSARHSRGIDRPPSTAMMLPVAKAKSPPARLTRPRRHRRLAPPPRRHQSVGDAVISLGSLRRHLRPHDFRDAHRTHRCPLGPEPQRKALVPHRERRLRHAVVCPSGEARSADTDVMTITARGSAGFCCGQHGARAFWVRNSVPRRLTLHYPIEISRAQARRIAARHRGDASIC